MLYLKWAAIYLGFGAFFSSLSGLLHAWQLSGHTKAQYQYNNYGSDSAFAPLLGQQDGDALVNVRLNLLKNKNNWAFEADYELAAYHSDKLELEQAAGLNDGTYAEFTLPNDNRRFFNLSQTVEQDGPRALVQRIDRLALSYQRQDLVLKLGRQALSWGNGMMFSVMDLLNPFDPQAIDTEYKSGDDMLYAQYLQGNGNDLQFSWVLRRDENGEHNSDVDSYALKYHGLWRALEYDVLVARHYGTDVLGIGGSVALAGSLLRADWVQHHDDGQVYNNAVASLSYSWTAMGKPSSAILEYYHNDFGFAEPPYSAGRIAENSALAKRLLRGELYNLGRNYLGASLLLELHPLWQLSPNLFVNLDDRSYLTQLLTIWDVSQNSRLTSGLIWGNGSDGSEFSGPELVPGAFASSRWAVYAELAWYF
ncbi:hypothetical protein [Agaribacterium haliotis]|uniref:hypothetical protein n=1 Tax=Agaribacterium haliotis TaxID=2013869 RepID=UPI001178BCC5|nr:hypothetical protein [Agaribacterium haliotis]